MTNDERDALREILGLLDNVTASLDSEARYLGQAENMLRGLIGAVPAAPANCTGCEGSPAEGNNPCAVCGRTCPPAAPAEGGQVRARAFRLRNGDRGWTRWMGMDEFYHYNRDGHLVKGPHPDWQIEYAYSGAPPAASVDVEQFREACECMKLWYAGRWTPVCPEKRAIADRLLAMIDSAGGEKGERSDALDIAEEEEEEEEDAALNDDPQPADCTCPSGSGSLRWPCPQHPPAEGDGAKDHMQQLRSFVAWEQEHNPTKTHIAKWALDEIERLRTRPAATAQVAEGFVLVPAALTAENGAKAALMGEFGVRFEIPCPECDGAGTDGCVTCDGAGTFTDQRDIDWTTIKAIYSAAIAHFSAAPVATKGGVVDDKRTIYDQRTKVTKACEGAAPLLYTALNNLLEAVRERDLQRSIESVVLSNADMALTAALATGEQP